MRSIDLEIVVSVLSLKSISSILVIFAVITYLAERDINDAVTTEGRGRFNAAPAPVWQH